MARIDPNTQAHLEWMGFVQPQGLVVSAPALVQAGAILNRNDREGQSLLIGCVEERVFGDDRNPKPWIPDFEQFARNVLGWTFAPSAYFLKSESPSPSTPESLEVHLADFGETLRPDYAIRYWPPPEDSGPEWQLLARTFPVEQELDVVERGGGGLEASPHSKMERLLRGTGTPAGVIFNGRTIRLISAPKGEGSGWLDFRVADMLETAGRPIVSALRLLLGQSRLLTGPQEFRLPALLEQSRAYQNVVSERLAEQVLHALYELVRGFQAAHDASGGTLLREPLESDPDRVYRGLLTVLLRLVFLLYAEQRDLLSDDETYIQSYSIGGLYDRLREDAAHYPDTMDQRYGAWAQLVVMFRMLYGGARSGSMRLPERKGGLFDPDRFSFLEGEPVRVEGPLTGQAELPKVPDGTIYRVLEKLLVLEGERISYRALDVEQIGSVYETMMGFRLETATGASVAIKSTKKNGAPTTINLDELLTVDPNERRKWIRIRTDRKITDRVNKGVRQAKSLEVLHAALDAVLDKHAIPDRVPAGAMALQPSEERRRSGSHYTPRSLTEPIVQRTLDPVIADIRERGDGRISSGQILEIKICDPSMGSGAFLVEACRQLGDLLVEARQSLVDTRPAQQAEVMAARRDVAQSCLFGVDRNVVAVDLAKMSLWLATLARDRPLTFVDHALRHGDTLVGLTRTQIERFHWNEGTVPLQKGFWHQEIEIRINELLRLRKSIREERPENRAEVWRKAQEQSKTIRLIGDLVLAAFFNNEKGKNAARKRYAESILDGIPDDLENPLLMLRNAVKPIASFHWEIEFPEIFERSRPGFDVIIGNPPFAGKNSLIGANVVEYLKWLKILHAGSHGNADLAAHFVRRSFNLLRERGALGMVATNTIAQGDTRSTGLRWIATNGGVIYDATRRLPWPGQAAIIISVVHILRENRSETSRLDLGQPLSSDMVQLCCDSRSRLCTLDGVEVNGISAFLVPGMLHDDPQQLRRNMNKSFVGSYVLGMGFTFDDESKNEAVGAIEEMNQIIAKTPKCNDRIFPYIGGKELLTSPTHAYHRYIINFHDYPLRRNGDLHPSWMDAGRETRERWLYEGIVPRDYPHPVAEDWPELLQIVEERVRPMRNSSSIEFQRKWWQYAARRVGLYQTIPRLDRVLAVSRHSQHIAFTFLPSNLVYADSLYIFPFDFYSSFSLLQSRIHEIWTRRFASTLKDDCRYSASDCFETFPFPQNFSDDPALEESGEEYYEFRADLMRRREEGLTKTYHRFHDPDENDSEIVRLRRLHNRADQAVLGAYGWTDVPTKCQFVCDHGVDGEAGSKRARFRYRWPDDVQDEVLGRLLARNADLAEAE